MFARRTSVLTFLLGAAGLFALPVQLDAQCTGPSFDAGLHVEGGGSGSAGEIASGDVNGDGRTDLVVPGQGANTISIILGNASGAPTVVLVTSVIRPIAAGVGDFNKDGKADLAVSRVTNPSFGDVALAVLLGDGAGGFGPPTDFPAQLSKPLVVADFNNDTNPDVFLGSGSPSSQVLLGNGSGGFSAPINVLVPGSVDVVAADFNNDNKVDLAMVYDSSAFVSVALGDGTGHFGSAASFPVSSARSIAAADLNNDGKLDLVTAGQSDGVSVLLGNGIGNFGTATPITTGFPTTAVALGDFNGDGKPDIATTGQTLFTILIGDGNGGAGPTTNYTTSPSLTNIVTGDLNGDGKVDVALTHCSSCIEAASVFLATAPASCVLRWSWLRDPVPSRLQTEI